MEPTGSLAALAGGTGGDLSMWRLLQATVLLLGLQFAWAVELAYGTPYLQELGLDKSKTSLVWLAGPLSGLLVQPIIGTLSDNHRSRFGKRRPFICIGAACVVLSLLLIAFSKDLAPLDPASMPQPPTKDGPERGSDTAIWLAVIGFYLLDFSINVVQSASRALIVDVIPIHHQHVANAWASIMINVGNIVGYSTGFLDLSAVFHVRSKSSQMKLLCLVAATVFLGCVAWTVVTTREKPTTSSSIIMHTEKRWYHSFLDIFRSLKQLPTFIMRICKVQFFSWIGWFPFLFYSSTYVATYVANSHKPFDSPQGNYAARMGSQAYLFFSIVSFAFSVVLPIMTSRGIVGLRQLWRLSFVCFAVLTWSTLFVFSALQAQILIASFGFCWSVTTWVPMALIGEYINEHDISDKESDFEDGGDRDSITNKAEEPHGSLYMPVPSSSSSSIPAPPPLTSRPSQSLVSPQVSSAMSSSMSRTRSPHPRQEQDQDEVMIESDRPPLYPSSAPVDSFVLHRRSNPSLSAGSILGIHNCFVVVPQLLVSLLASALFSYVDEDAPLRTGDQNDGIGWLFRIGGASALISLLISRKLSRPS
ncbi:hypothetical protein RI367_000301 [Sorochytrium milnesiophthora]